MILESYTHTHNDAETENSYPTFKPHVEQLAQNLKVKMSFLNKIK